MTRVESRDEESKGGNGVDSGQKNKVKKMIKAKVKGMKNSKEK